MANIANIRRQGTMLVVVMDDGSSDFAYPTGAGTFIIAGGGDGPGPVPPPANGDTFIWPFSLDLVTSEYGPRNGRLHAGIDFGRGAANVAGSPVIASAAGTVIVANKTNSHGGYGNAVVIDHGSGRHTLYGHLLRRGDGSADVDVNTGQRVAKGQRLGGVGQSGASQGLHLHFETHEDGYRWNASARNPRLMMTKWNA